MIIPDEEPLYRETVATLIKDSQVVVTTGGLGPTSDDLTREVIARVAGVDLEFAEHIWQSIVNRFKPRIVPDTNRKQALIPRGFEVFLNPNGTAPGFAGVIDGCHVAALPGPPRELHPMCEKHLKRYLAKAFQIPTTDRLIGTALLVSESALEEALQKNKIDGIEWGTRAEEFRITFTIRGADAAAQEAVFEAIRSDLGAFHIHSGEVAPERLLIETVARRSMRLVTAESCTGGLIGKLITDVPGASDVYWGSYVTYDNRAKNRVLGVDTVTLESHGAVSEEVVMAMAEGALRAADGDADVAVAVSGIAGPGGGTEEKPVGTVWVAVAAVGAATEAYRHTLGSTRDLIRRRAAVAALLLCNHYLKKIDEVVTSS